MPDGWLPTNNPANDIHWTRAKTSNRSLPRFGVKPTDIRYIGISHTHPDHIGNIERFPSVTVLIQKIEYDNYFAAGQSGTRMPPGDNAPSFSKDHPVQLVQEDLDVFGDGSVMIVFTPGHTPGHRVVPRPFAANRMDFVVWRRGSFAGKLGHPPHSIFRHNAGRPEASNAFVDAAHG